MPVFGAGVTPEEYTRQKMNNMGCDNEVIPDISLTRVFKWAIVILIALALGERIWKIFGPKLTEQMHKALGTFKHEEKTDATV